MKKNDRRGLYWTGKKHTPESIQKISDTKKGAPNLKLRIPIVVYCHGELFGRYESITHFAIDIGSERSAKRLSRGWVPTRRSRFYGFKVERNE